MIDIIR